MSNPEDPLLDRINELAGWRTVTDGYGSYESTAYMLPDDTDPVAPGFERYRYNINNARLMINGVDVTDACASFSLDVSNVLPEDEDFRLGSYSVEDLRVRPLQFEAHLTWADPNADPIRDIRHVVESYEHRYIETYDRWYLDRVNEYAYLDRTAEDDMTTSDDWRTRALREYAAIDGKPTPKADTWTCHGCQGKFTDDEILFDMDGKSTIGQAWNDFGHPYCLPCWDAHDERKKLT